MSDLLQLVSNRISRFLQWFQEIKAAEETRSVGAFGCKNQSENQCIHWPYRSVLNGCVMDDS